MTCWWGWYTVYWAEASPRLNTSKERTGRIFMAGDIARGETSRGARSATVELEGSSVRQKETGIIPNNTRWSNK
jgi:hypothetical protein